MRRRDEETRGSDPADPTSGWSVVGERDPQTVGPDWLPAEPCPIHDVAVQEIRGVATGTGTLTEIYREDWKLDDGGVAQVFQRSLDPGAVSAWHAHGLATDRLFAARGRVRLVLYDARMASPSHGTLWERVFGRDRPLLVVVPPGVWHGVQALGHEPSLLVNVVDRAFAYEGPDHWRLPADTAEIPYTFSG
ncbi:MAG: dTDP-4-dehydrorhamnose 3,5-epimerase [Myxococcota bacterium]|nr:dTDP-4-dehydrorhamnose 3,5-epimerase [Myxococcota bacterium]